MDSIQVDNKFGSYSDLEESLKIYQRQKCVNLYKKESRTIEAASKRAPNKPFKRELKYSELVFACVHNGKQRQKKTTGERPNQQTIRTGCEFVIKVRVTPDGQKLSITNINDQHNHILSEDTYQYYPCERRLDNATAEQVARDIKLGASRKQIQRTYASETGKLVTMQDIHNIAAASKRKLFPKSSSNEVKDLDNFIREQYPSVYTEFVLKEDGVVAGIYLQDMDMKTNFQRFPELLLADATHKTNDQQMPFYSLMIIDGNGDSHIAAAFLVQEEDIQSLRKMMEIFTQQNPEWDKVQVVITDKDMTERKVFKEKMPQVSLQICLYHVLRTFNRELTIDKMGITSGERLTPLSITQELAYARNENIYMQKYEEFTQLCPNDRVKSYFDTNWHNIRNEWVEGLKAQQFNLGTRTNNRLESFFQKLKDFVKTKDSLKSFFIGFMDCLATLRNERRLRAIKSITKVSTVPLGSATEVKYNQLLTKFAFQKVQEQMEYSSKVVVLSASEVQTTHGILTVNNCCECSFYSTMKLPCRHIFAVKRFNNEDLFIPEVVNERWTREYNYSYLPQRANDVIDSPTQVSVLQTPKNKILSANGKYKQAMREFNKLAGNLANVGMVKFNRYIEQIQKINELVLQQEDFEVIHHIRLPLVEEINTETDAEADTLITEPCVSQLEIEIIHTSATDNEVHLNPDMQDTIEPLNPEPLNQEPLANHANDETETVHTHCGSDDDPLFRATFAPKPKKRGRPKGGVTSVVGLPSSKRQRLSENKKIPFHRKDSKVKDRMMLSWFVDEETVKNAIDGTIIEEKHVETMPLNLPSSCLDKGIDINQIKHYFDSDAWLIVVTTLEARRQIGTYLCKSCDGDLSDVRSVGCDSCLSWLHYSCAGIKTEPKKKFWFCKDCQ